MRWEWILRPVRTRAEADQENAPHFPGEGPAQGCAGLACMRSQDGGAQQELIRVHPWTLTPRAASLSKSAILQICPATSSFKNNYVWFVKCKLGDYKFL